VWFYATSRYFTNEYYLASRYYPLDVSAVNRVSDSVGPGRLDLNFDLYNAFNSDAITLQLNNYGPAGSCR